MLIDLELGQEGQYALHDHADFIIIGIVDHHLVAPGKLALHPIQHAAGFIKNIIAVKPGKQPLFEVKFHLDPSFLPI